jgi:hypothetical protein
MFYIKKSEIKGQHPRTFICYHIFQLFLTKKNLVFEGRTRGQIRNQNSGHQICDSLP